MKDGFVWVFSADGAGWIFGFLSTLGWLIPLLRRKRERRLVVDFVEESRLLNIDPTVSARTKVYFDGEIVEGLSQRVLEIYNSSESPIRDIEMCFSVPDGCRLLSVSLRSTDGMSVDSSLKNESGAIFRIQYLNPFKEHGQILIASFTCDRLSGPIGIAASGEGWSLKMRKRQQLDWKLLLIPAGIAFGLVVLMLPLILKAIKAEGLFGLLGLVLIGVCAGMLSVNFALKVSRRFIEDPKNKISPEELNKMKGIPRAITRGGDVVQVVESSRFSDDDKDRGEG